MKTAKDHYEKTLVCIPLSRMQTQNLEKNENVFVEKGFKEQKINEMK